MITWSDMVIGLLPFAFIMLLLWMRLRATKVSAKVAVKFIAKVSALIAVSILGLGCVAKGWNGKNSWLIMAGATVTIASVLALRWSLQRIWEKFPLPSNGSEQDGRNGN